VAVVVKDGLLQGPVEQAAVAPVALGLAPMVRLAQPTLVVEAGEHLTELLAQAVPVLSSFE
jgi:hypothetical protein